MKKHNILFLLLVKLISTVLSAVRGERIVCGVVSKSYKVQVEEGKAFGLSSLQNSDDTV